MVNRRTFGRVTTLGTAGCLLARSGAAATEPRFDPVTRDAPVREVLWTWTTEEQAAELRAGGALLTRTESAGLGRGTLFHHLESIGGREAELLLQPRFAKGRYAWVNAWSTVQGFAGEEYGPELVRIQLKAGARFAMLAVTGGEWRFVDSTNADVPPAEALAEPERLAGVCFVNDSHQYEGTFGACRSTGTGGDPYREIYVGNESLIESWSLGTKQIHEELQRNVANLGLFESWLRRNGSPVEAGFRCAWTDRAFWPRRVNGVIERYESSLAFLDEAHVPTPAKMWRIATALTERLFEPRPFTGRP